MSSNSVTLPPGSSQVPVFNGSNSGFQRSCMSIFSSPGCSIITSTAGIANFSAGISHVPPLVLAFNQVVSERLEFLFRGVFLEHYVNAVPAFPYEFLGACLRVP